MKELTCFVIGLLVGGLVMKKCKEVETLEKELDRERARGVSAGLKEVR